MTSEDRLRQQEWHDWLALSLTERRDRLAYARGEVDMQGMTNNIVLAGKALHDQPYGFTWEDVDALRAAFPRPGEKIPATVDMRPLWDLRDRLAALLPPR